MANKCWFTVNKKINLIKKRSLIRSLRSLLKDLTKPLFSHVIIQPIRRQLTPWSRPKDLILIILLKKNIFIPPYHSELFLLLQEGKETLLLLPLPSQGHVGGGVLIFQGLTSPHRKVWHRLGPIKHHCNGKDHHFKID